MGQASSHDAQMPLSLVTAALLISSQDCNASHIILSQDSEEIVHTPLPNPVVFVWSITYLQPIRRSSAAPFAGDHSKHFGAFVSVIMSLTVPTILDFRTY